MRLFKQSIGTNELLGRVSRLFIVFATLALFVICTSWFIEPVTLTPDSREYLTLAESLLAAPQDYLTSNNPCCSDVPYYSVWPIGYPATIALASSLSGLSVFWASKLVNILLAGTLLGSLTLVFKKASPTYAAVLLLAPYLKIFTYTWSESLFLLFLLVFTISIARLVDSGEKPKIGWVVTLGKAALGLFLTRYIGVFALGVITLIIGREFLTRSNRNIFWHIALLLLIVTSIECLYLYNNWIQTAFFTGIERVSAPETNTELVGSLFRAIALELFLPLSDLSGRNNGVLIIALLTFQSLFFLHMLDTLKGSIKLGCFIVDSIAHSLFFVGICYYGAIVSLRWISDFDTFNYRLLAPGTFLLTLGVIRVVELSSTSDRFRQLSLWIFSMAFISICISTYDMFYVYKLIN